MANSPRDNNHVPAILGASNADGVTTIPPHVDSSTNRLLVDSRSEQYGHETVNDGTKSVTTAGTRVQLDADTACKRVFVQAHIDNIDEVVVGGSGVVAAKNGRRGIALQPSQGDWFKVSNLNKLYVDALTSGDKVNYYYEN